MKTVGIKIPPRFCMGHSYNPMQINNEPDSYVCFVRYLPVVALARISGILVVSFLMHMASLLLVQPVPCVTPAIY